MVTRLASIFYCIFCIVPAASRNFFHQHTFLLLSLIFDPRSLLLQPPPHDLLLQLLGTLIQPVLHLLINLSMLFDFHITKVYRLDRKTLLNVFEHLHLSYVRTDTSTNKLLQVLTRFHSMYHSSCLIWFNCRPLPLLHSLFLTAYKNFLVFPLPF